MLLCVRCVLLQRKTTTAEKQMANIVNSLIVHGESECLQLSAMDQTIFSSILYGEETNQQVNVNFVKNDVKCCV